MTDALKRLSDEGVAIWLDDLSRSRLTSGNLADLVREKHVVGVTTNPTIFQKAIGGGSDAYDAQLRDLAVRGVTVDEAVRMMTAADVREAADVLRPVYDASNGRDGRVSIEVDPRLAHHTEVEGLPAIATVIGEGISVNVTLIFSLERYRGVMDAYLTGLERAKAAGHNLSTIESVASFFVSRVDTEIDKRLDKIASPEAKALKGKAAIANARLAYEAYEAVFGSVDGGVQGSERWKALAAAGAKPQRPLWASTGVKDPAYDDTMYVVELVAPGTVNTMPEATLDAVADHGVVRGDTVDGSYQGARAELDTLAALGVSYDDVVQLLEDEGVEKFETSWKELLDTVSASLQKFTVKGGSAQ
jgi:transaldolase